MAQRLIDVNQLAPGKIKLAHSRIYEMLTLGLMPQPLKIGRRNFWVEAEIDDWIAALIAKRDAAGEAGRGVPLIPAIRRGASVEVPRRKGVARALEQAERDLDEDDRRAAAKAAPAANPALRAH